MSDDATIDELTDQLRSLRTQADKEAWMKRAVSIFTEAIGEKMECDPPKKVSENLDCPVSERRYSFSCRFPRLKEVASRVETGVRATGLSSDAFTNAIHTESLLHSAGRAALGRGPLGGRNAPNVYPPECPTACPQKLDEGCGIAQVRAGEAAGTLIADLDVKSGTLTGKIDCFALCKLSTKTGKAFTDSAPKTVQPGPVVRGEHDANTSLVGGGKAPCPSTDNKVTICAYITKNDGVTTKDQADLLGAVRVGAAKDAIAGSLCEKGCQPSFSDPEPEENTFAAGEGRVCTTYTYHCDEVRHGCVAGATPRYASMLWAGIERMPQNNGLCDGRRRTGTRRRQYSWVPDWDMGDALLGPTQLPAVRRLAAAPRGMVAARSIQED